MLGVFLRNDKILFTMNRSIPIDTEDLIRAVEQYRAIWDTEDEWYHNKYEKEEAWSSVCLSVVSDWETLAKDEKYARRNEIKKKWNNVRDYFKKLVVAEKSSDGELHEKKRKYLYDDLLEFIRPVYENPKSKTVRMRLQHKPIPDRSDSTSAHVDDDPNQSSDSEAKDDDEDELENLTFVNVSPPEDARQTPSPEPAKQNKPVLRRLRSRPSMTLERPTVRSMEDKSNTNAPNEDDSDLLFLRSLLPDMKKLSDSQKFDFKLGIMKLYRNISRRGDSVEQDRLCDSGKSNPKVKMELEGFSFDDEDD